MSFDQYFEGAKRVQSQCNDDNDDWYGIVEQALHAADLESCRLRQQIELNLMKPLPIIPEDENAVEEPKILNNTHNFSRRPSSVSVVDFDSPLSSESSALDSWASAMCSPSEGSMRSLRNKPYTRKSSSTGSVVSYRSASAGSSVRPESTSSSVYSTDTSVDSHGKSAKSVGAHSRDVSTASTREEAKREERPVGSCFEFSDDEEEVQSESSTTRRESSASSYVRHLRKAALSFRMATSRRAPRQAKTLSTPTTAEVSALSTWLLRASLAGRVSSSPTSEEMESEGQLMSDAAESAKARRVSGIRCGRERRSGRIGEWEASG